MRGSIADLASFFLRLDELKSVDRRSYISSGERLENSAEHSWHLAMACWTFTEILDDDFDTDKLLKLALVHDLGEIDAGDTLLYSETRSTAHVEERKSVDTTASHPGNSIAGLLEIWDEQEHGNSKETRLLRVVDRMLPFLLNIANQGRAWRDNGVCKSQVLSKHRFIQEEYPEIYEWFLSQLEHAVENDWLDPA